MSAIVVQRRGAWAVVVESGSAPARHCPGVEQRGGKVRRHRVWTDEHRGDECPECGQALGPTTHERRRHWHGPYRTKTEAKAAARQLGVHVDEGIYRPTTSLSVREFFEEKWLPAIASQFRPTTLAGYRSNIANHVIPAIGATQLRALTPEKLNRFYAELLGSGRVKRKGVKRDGSSDRSARDGGLSERTVQHVHKVLHRALRDAVRWHLIVRNPADDADPPKPRAVEMKCWTPAELRAFVEHAPDDRLVGLWHLVSMTGMRRGELCGLRWSDVDLDGAKLSVSHTITAAGYSTHSGPPKTKASRRVLTLDPATLAAFRRHRTRQSTERLAAGEAWLDSGLVFTREDGAAMHPQSLTYLFKKRVTSAGLPKIRLHDVRHSYATVGLSAGEHPKVMQERLGHSSIAITLDVYSHVTEGVARESADRVAAHILGG
jgi:integrase